MLGLSGAARLVDKNTVTFERVLPASPEALWDLIATKNGMARWFMPTTDEVMAGERFDFQGGWGGTVAEYVRPRHVVFTPDGAEDAFLRFDIEADGDGCVFRLTDRMGSAVDAAKLFPDAPDYDKFQPGGPGTHWSGVLAGYHGFVDALEQQVTGTTAKPFDYDAACRAYMRILSAWHGERP